MRPLNTMRLRRLAFLAAHVLHAATASDADKDKLPLHKVGKPHHKHHKHKHKQHLQTPAPTPSPAPTPKPLPAGNGRRVLVWSLPVRRRHRRRASP